MLLAGLFQLFIAMIEFDQFVAVGQLWLFAAI
jgi:hypothetical protein